MDELEHARIFSDGFEQGLLAAKSMHSADLQVMSLAHALDALGQHIAQMRNAGEETHERCVECSTIDLLAVVIRTRA